jgi:hypothetical protein
LLFFINFISDGKTVLFQKYNVIFDELFSNARNVRLCDFHLPVIFSASEKEEANAPPRHCERSEAII